MEVRQTTQSNAQDKSRLPHSQFASTWSPASAPPPMIVQSGDDRASIKNHVHARFLLWDR